MLGWGLPGPSDVRSWTWVGSRANPLQLEVNHGFGAGKLRMSNLAYPSLGFKHAALAGAAYSLARRRAGAQPAQSSADTLSAGWLLCYEQSFNTAGFARFCKTLRPFESPGKPPPLSKGNVGLRGKNPNKRSLQNPIRHPQPGAAKCKILMALGCPENGTSFKISSWMRPWTQRTKAPRTSRRQKR